MKGHFLVNNRGRYIFEEIKQRNNEYLQGLEAKLHLKKVSCTNHNNPF